MSVDRWSYSQAQALAASSADLAGVKCRAFVARAAANDWNAVIMTRTAFEWIPLLTEFESQYRGREVERMRQEILAAKERALASGGKAMSVKKLESRLQAQEEKTERLLEHPVEPGLTFEQTGFDYLIVDQLHDFKNLGPDGGTRMRRITGTYRLETYSSSTPTKGNIP